MLCRQAERSHMTIITNRPHSQYSEFQVRQYCTVLLKLSCPTAHHGGAWGERRNNSCPFFISALDGDELSAPRPGRALPPGKGPRYLLDRRLGGPQSRSGHRGYRKNPFAFVRDRTPIRGPVPVVQALVRLSTD
jgi:hypothetical protein